MLNFIKLAILSILLINPMKTNGMEKTESINVTFSGIYYDNYIAKYKENKQNNEKSEAVIKNSSIDVNENELKVNETKNIKLKECKLSIKFNFIPPKTFSMGNFGVFPTKEIEIPCNKKDYNISVLLPNQLWALDSTLNYQNSKNGAETLKEYHSKIKYIVE